MRICLLLFLTGFSFSEAVCLPSFERIPILHQSPTNPTIRYLEHPKKDLLLTNEENKQNKTVGIGTYIIVWSNGRKFKGTLEGVAHKTLFLIIKNKIFLVPDIFLKKTIIEVFIQDIHKVAFYKNNLNPDKFAFFLNGKHILNFKSIVTSIITKSIELQWFYIDSMLKTKKGWIISGYDQNTENKSH